MDIYKIIKITDLEGNDCKRGEHRVGRMVTFEDKPTVGLSALMYSTDKLSAICTTPVKKCRVLKGGMIFTTMNSIYTLKKNL
jgi:hypothetical protein